MEGAGGNPGDSPWEDISPGDSRDFTELPAIPGTQGMSLVDIGIVVANLDMSGTYIT